jgi:DNA-binding CsgD family transcriptional regulator
VDLIGRDRECARIEEFLERVQAGQGEGLLLRGDAGIGKSALMRFAADRADGFLVLETSGVASEMSVAFAGLLPLVRPVVRYLPELPLAQADALRGALGLAEEWQLAPDRLAVGAALLGLLSWAGENQPVLVVVDDAHWLDDESLRAILFAGRRISLDRVGIIAATRRVDREALDPRAFTAVEVNDLEAAEARRLASRVRNRQLTDDGAARLHAIAGGNPLALTELAWADLDALPVGPAPSVSVVLEDAYAARMRDLSPEGQRALVVAAADESLHAGTIIAALVRLGLDAGALIEAERAKLIVLDGERVFFSHPLVRSAVYQHADALARRAAHGALADVLDGDWQRSRRAMQRAAATVEPDEQVAAELEAAAEDASARTGFAAAAGILERAARLTPDREARTRRLLAAGSARWDAGDAQRARALLDEAVENAPSPTLRADIQVERGRAGLLAIDDLAREAELVESVDLVRAQRLWAVAAVAAGFDRQYALALRYAELGGAASRADGMLGAALMANGRYAEAVPLLRAVMDTTDADPVLVCFSAGFLGEYERGYATADRALDEARRSGAVVTAAWLSDLLCDYAFTLGRIAIAVAAAEEARTLAHDAELPLVATWSAITLAAIATHSGASERATMYGRAAAESRVGLAAGPVRDYPGWLSGLALLIQGDAVGAVAVLSDVVEIDVPLVFNLPTSASFDLVEAAIRSHDRALAEDLVARLAPLCQPAWSLAALDRVRGLLASDETADTLLARSIEGFVALGVPLEEGRSRLAYGEWLRRAGQRVNARTQLRRAVEIFDKLGYVPWAGRARGELAASGETLRARASLDLSEALTPQELQVARIVADGVSNRDAAARLFLSTKTIEAHLHRVYRKLGITGRDQLAAALASRPM